VKRAITKDWWLREDVLSAAHLLLASQLLQSSKARARVKQGQGQGYEAGRGVDGSDGHVAAATVLLLDHPGGFVVRPTQRAAVVAVQLAAHTPLPELVLRVSVRCESFQLCWSAL
jgi:hypothetical protein